MLDPRGNYTLLAANCPDHDDPSHSSSSPSANAQATFFDKLRVSLLINRQFPVPSGHCCSSALRSLTVLVAGLVCLLLLSYYFFPFNAYSRSSYFKSAESFTSSNPLEGEMDESDSQFFKQRIVHLDLKGAAARPEFLAQLFPFFARLRFNAILMEYEDMFPYWGELGLLARKSAYNQSTVEELNLLAQANGLELIPLIQTFGHMEFVLKKPEFVELREDPDWADTICPSNERSILLIRQMLGQVRSLHPRAKSIHIGSDEAWHVAKEEKCLHRLNTTLRGSLERLKLEHISRVAKMAREEFGFGQVFAWNDMFEKTEVALLNRLAELLTPVVWGYARDVTKPGYFPQGLFQRYDQVFHSVLFASAYKGANGISQQFVDIDRYMDNLVSYRALYHQNEASLHGRLSGIVLTGWQRFAHVKPLCELLPLGIPAMAKQALYMANWDRNDPVDNGRVKHFLQCPNNLDHQLESRTYKGHTFPSSLEAQMAHCHFPGVDLYKQMENVRFLLWKYQLAVEDEEDADAIEAEYQEMRQKKLAPLLANYFFEDTVKEWMAQHQRLADFHADDTSMPRFDPI